METDHKKYLSFGFLVAAFLWLCLWATYNTDVSLFFVKGFPAGPVNLFHGLRSLVPFLAIIISVCILFKKRKSFSWKFFKTPLGLLSIFTVVGIFSSIILSKQPGYATYWGILYGSVILILVAVMSGSEPLEKLKLIININWAIAGIIALALLGYFFLQPGIFSSLRVTSLVCQLRPYETIGSLKAGAETLGMVGSRPTGWARYAGIIALVALCRWLWNGEKRKRRMWGALFLISSLVLFFSKGKTEIAAFLVAFVAVLFLYKKMDAKLWAALLVMVALTASIIFFSIPCTNNIVAFFHPAAAASPVAPTNVHNIVSLPTTIAVRTSIVTLSGRTTGIWPDALHLFYHSPIIGFGFQADRFFLADQHAHNTILHALIQAGLLGTIPLVLAYALTVLFLWKLLKNPTLPESQKMFLMELAAVLTFLLVRGITESLAFFSADWLFMAPIIACISVLWYKKGE